VKKFLQHTCALDNRDHLGRAHTYRFNALSLWRLPAGMRGPSA
jgi:hypothetical protein